MSKLITRTIRDDIYSKQFTLVLGGELDNFREYLLRKHDVIDVQDAVGVPNMQVGGMCVIIETSAYLWLSEFSWTIEDQALLVHEVSHIVDLVLDISGIPLDYDNTEVRAYYMQYVYTNVLNCLLKICPYEKK